MLPLSNNPPNSNQPPYKNRVDLPSHLNNHSLSLKELIFVDFDDFPPLVCLCTVIYHHWPRVPTLFEEWNVIHVCAVLCVHRHSVTGSPFKSYLRRLGSVQLVNALFKGIATKWALGMGTKPLPPGQALDHKSNLLTLCFFAWQLSWLKSFYTLQIKFCNSKLKATKKC